MRIVAEYAFNNGKVEVEKRYPHLLAEVREVIAAINSAEHRTKKSKEKTKNLRMLYNPKALNKVFKEEFGKRNWRPKKEKCQYATEYYIDGYKPTKLGGKGAFREMDFLKEKLGIEVQFGKYAFMVYNVCAKMTIFRNLGHIDCGIEIVPVRGFTKEMSTGVAYFEQFTWDLHARGVADIDIPVLILGIDADVLISSDESKGIQELEDSLQKTLLK